MLFDTAARKKEKIVQMAKVHYRKKTKYYYARQKLCKSQPGNQHQGLMKLQLEQPVVSAKTLATIWAGSLL